MDEAELRAALESVSLPKPAFWDAQYLKNAGQLSKPQYEMVVERDVPLQMRDGVTLRADVFRPDADGAFPGLLALSAYGKDCQSCPIPAQPINSWVFDHNVEAGDIEFFVRRGYVYVIPDERGLGKSEGKWNGPFSVQEQEDGHDIVEWIARQAWCNGKVGMMGISWFGMIQRFVAEQQPPSLKAIFPYEAANDLYGVAYEGGIIQPFWWELEREIPAHTTQSEAELLYSPEELEERFNAVARSKDIALNTNYTRLLARRGSAFFDQLLHPTNDEFWEKRRSKDKVGKIKVPVYTAGCWIPFFKPFSDAIWDDMNDPSLDVPKKAGIFGHHMHTQLPGPPDLKYEALRWYDHWLKDVDTGIMDEPPIRLFIMGPNQYRYENEWPLARTQWTKMYLRPFGQMNPLPDPGMPDPDPLVHRPPIISAERSAMVYSMPPASAPTELTGPVVLHLFAELDQPDANFVAKLWAVGPGEHRFPLTRGVLKASHRALDEQASTFWNPVHPHTDPQPVVPGEVNEYVIAFPPISYVLKPGEHLELEITTCDPMEIPWHHIINVMGPLPSMTLTYYKLHRDREHQSYLLLPLIPGGA
ncbi:MAG: CocE/NonD family hydrolase [Pseudomonadota bacterium]|nr:CocE/NonD family hydrolase [Pseudomonadota bacterium]